MTNARLLTFAALAATVISIALLAAQSQQPLPLEPVRERGASVTPAFEGWYENADGSFSLLVGYFNRNGKEALDIPVGANNRIEPGEIDQGQPTHFQTGRRWGVFAISVPKDFGAKAITWTIVSNGESQSVPLSLKKGYIVTPFHEAGMGNRPPVFRFSEGGPKLSGPPARVAATLSGMVNQPLAINVWVEDQKETTEARSTTRPAPSVANVSFHKFRGPGTVTFVPERVAVAKQGDMVGTKATFSLPGEYLVRVQGNDESGEGGGGFQCCWTNAHVNVLIK